MKHPFNNLFTAPDAADILRDRNFTFRSLIVMAGAGIVFVCTLLGGYVMGTWFLAQTLPVQPIMEALETPAAELSEIERRLAELGEASNEPYDAAEANRRVEELGDASTNDTLSAQEENEIRETRLKELGG